MSKAFVDSFEFNPWSTAETVYYRFDGSRTDAVGSFMTTRPQHKQENLICSASRVYGGCVFSKCGAVRGFRV